MAVLILPIVIFLVSVIGILILVKPIYKRKKRNKAMMMDNDILADVRADIAMSSMFSRSSINGNYYCEHSIKKLHVLQAAPRNKKIVGS